ncbi:MAG: heavy metal-binding domain-containing protein [Candidatus Thermoplasmatota archaeon]|nr:heavy metal-binding domain-containing protein [Candidatus Thermoplasmatota archaeon]
MILTNLNIIPGRRIEETLGIAYGYASVKEKEEGRPMIDSSGKGIPWKDTSEDFEVLFREAEARLTSSCTFLGGDAVIKVEGKLSRDGSGNPEMLLMGTAVKLTGMEVFTSPPAEKAEVQEDAGDAISIKFDGETMSWKPPQATNPTVDVLRKMRGRTERDTEDRDDAESLIVLAREAGISQERMKLLIDGGLDTLEKIAQKPVADISTIEGINPTQARIINKKARQMLSME